jgi:hypothetical protein
VTNKDKMRPDLKHTVIMPDSGGDLLRLELNEALTGLGFQVLAPRPEQLERPEEPHYLPKLLERRPALFLSVNLQGLRRGAGPLLLSAGIPILVWFVDNPWHLLSGMRDPSWKDFYLACTDQSFLEPLRRAGARRVLHWPLAAGRHMLERGEAEERVVAAPLLKRIIFVGRAVFPGFAGFFRGQELPPEPLDRAGALLRRGFGGGTERPDFDWWTRALGLEEQVSGFWPGKKARRPGLGAALCNMRWRVACLSAAGGAAGAGLTLFGDGAWREELASPLDLRPEVDYYLRLPALYREAALSLTLNSLLLPAGLTQRCFDIWAAGGFCLTDYSPGLAIFPAGLTAPVTFKAAEELPELAAGLLAAPRRREELRLAWREHIRAEHSYRRRLETILPAVLAPCAV